MATELKTKKNDANVEAFLQTIENEERVVCVKEYIFNKADEHI